MHSRPEKCHDLEDATVRVSVMSDSALNVARALRVGVTSALVWRIASGRLVSLGVTDSVITSSIQGARSVTAVDLDGDGKEEVCVASESGLEIYSQDSAGNWMGRQLENASKGLSIVVASDLDGDLDLDLVASGLSAASVDWYENRLPTWSWLRHEVDGRADGAIDLQAIDMDADNDQDILVAKFFVDEIWVYTNTGVAFQPQLVSSLVPGVTSIFATDVDGDATVDVVASANNGLVWFVGSGWGGPVEISFETNGVDDCWAADIDRDGDVDIVHAVTATDEIEWHANLDGTGTAWDSRTVASAGAPQRVIAADVLHGEYLDLFAANFADDAVVWYTYDGGSWFPNTVSTSVQGATDLTVMPGQGAIVSLGASVVWWHDLALVPAPTPAPTATPFPTILPVSNPTVIPTFSPTTFDEYRPTRVQMTLPPSLRRTRRGRQAKSERFFCPRYLVQRAGACRKRARGYLVAYFAVFTTIAILVVRLCIRLTYMCIKPYLIYYEPYYMPKVELVSRKWKKSCVRRWLCCCCPKCCASTGVLISAASWRLNKYRNRRATGKWSDDQDPLRPSDGVALKAGQCPVRVVTDIPRTSKRVRCVKTGEREITIL